MRTSKYIPVVGDMKRVLSRGLSAVLSVTDCEISSAIIMPDDVAEEKAKALYALGAHIEKVRPASIVDKKQVRHASLYLPARLKRIKSSLL